MSMWEETEQVFFNFHQHDKCYSQPNDRKYDYIIIYFFV